MYGWIWRRLPGSFVVKLALTCAVIAAVVVVLLWTVVFPFVSEWLGAPAVR